MVGKDEFVQCIKDEILEKLSLRNRYNFLNINLMSILKPKYMNFLREAQNFYVKFEKRNNITHTEDFYQWIPEIGEQGLITRVNPFVDAGLNLQPNGMVAEFMRVLATDFFDPQLAMGMGATVLAVNPLVLHHENIDIRLQALKELITA
jgi:hypothetical protein